MKNQDSQNKRLNAFEKNLLKATAMPPSEIEKIAGNPQLFSSVMTRIKTEKSKRKEKKVFGGKQIFLIKNWQKIGVSFAVLLIISLTAGNFILRRDKNSTRDLAADKNVESNFSSVNSSADIPPSKTNSQVATVDPINFKAKIKTPVSQKIVKKENIKFQTRTEKSGNKLSPKLPASDEQIFYSLVTPNQMEIGNGERRIVRAELSRPALFALGVNVAAGDDDNRKFKADLIVGADGIPQAIRLVE